MKIKMLFLSLVLLATGGSLFGAPAITVSGNSVSILGSAQTISLTCTLIDPNNTGNLRSGSNIITVFVTNTVTPGNVATCGPIYGNDVITDGYGNANTTYYKVQVFTVSGGIVASTPSLQQFYAFTGSGTVDLATATPLAPSFFAGPSGNVSMPGTLTVTGATTLNSSLTVSGTGTFTNINTISYVGGATPQVGGSADMGSQINAAYAALPSTGGKIIILPQTGGGAYNYSTPIVLNTAGKYASLEGVFTGNQTGPVTQGTALNYTPTTATTAMTIDVTVSQGGAFLPSTVLKNLTLINNGCLNTVGGCGSSATGIVFGPNGGCSQCKMENVKIAGFSVGRTISNGNVSWAMKDDNVSYVANGTGETVQAGQTSENMVKSHVVYANNGTGFSCLGGSNTTDVEFDSVSFDVNSTAGLNNTGCAFTLLNPHFENGGGTGASNAYIVQSNGEFTIVGGRVMEDQNAGGPTAQFFQVTGGSFNINGLNASAGRTVTNLIANSGGFGRVSYFTDAPTLVAPGANNEDTSKTCSVAYQCVVERIITNPAFNLQAAQFPVLYLTGPGAGSPAGVGGGSPLGVVYYNGSLNRTQIQDNGAAADNVNGTNNALTASSTDNVTNKTFTGITPFKGNTAALTADWTCGTGGTVSSCVAATIIGSGGGVPLTFTLPSVAQSYTLQCDGVVGQATAATANQWNLLTATNGATNVTANYTMATAATAFAAGAVTDQASTTTTFQIAPSWTLGGTATKMPFHIWAKIEGASASGTVVSLQLVAPTVGDLVTIYRGSSCRVF